MVGDLEDITRYVDLCFTGREVARGEFKVSSVGDRDLLSSVFDTPAAKYIFSDARQQPATYNITRRRVNTVSF